MRTPINSIFLILSFIMPLSATAAGMNVSDQLKEGGVPLLIVLALSILFLAVSLERLVNFRTKSVIPEGLVERVKPLWEARNFAAIEQVLAEEDSTLARVMRYMVAYHDRGFDFVSNGAGDIASMELRQHQQKAYALSIVATVAPIVGLLGTVLGMIEAFRVIAYANGMGNPVLLAGGISQALVNTAAGLAVALPALGMHHFLKHRLATLGLRLEKQINWLLNEWFLPVSTVKQSLKEVQLAH